ncbi:MAG TPA: DNA polymerase III subunit gamma/tau [Alphaproteobacteria bacterium]|nr:DNA polymerase III subunit gamma/tau [Alphaproteobacteria bacterium]
MPDTQPAYRVLARKYRPTSFAGLIGQEALVRTLTNAIRSGRLAHAWLLTGVRGVGKTTSARIIARALNCIGPDGKGGPTPEPCGVCDNCKAIAEDRHPDVIEMDAASRTGVDDIRELIEGVRYKPVMARTKIYIVDEVHMLSNQAFNALLKTLEEPPEHVKFIFATTESRKIPITVRSRCQRFDLRRVDADRLAEHLGGIAKEEGVKTEPNALLLIARAADGSVRDGLSILDQAISHAAALDGDGTVGEQMVRDMLGLADRGRVFDLLEAVMAGDAGGALDILGDCHNAGADAVILLQDMLELIHWVTRVKITPAIADDVAVPEAERERGRALADKLSLPDLTRAWQMLLKGLTEAQGAPHPVEAAEMALVRLAYAADLPTPADLVARLSNAPPAPASTATRASAAAAPAPSVVRPVPPPVVAATLARGAAPPPPPPPPQSAGPSLPATFKDMVELFAAKREAVLHTHLVHDIHLVNYEPGKVEIALGANAPATIAKKLAELLTEWTGARWSIAVSQKPGLPTLAQERQREKDDERAAAEMHPVVKAALEAFPGAKIVDVRRLDVPASTDTGEEPPEPLDVDVDSDGPDRE